MRNQLKNLFYVFILFFIGVTINAYSQEHFIVQTIYFKPANAAPLHDTKKKIADVVDATQRLYADEMQRNGFGNKTFRIERDKDNQVIVHLVNGKHDSWDYVDNTYNKIKTELPNRFNPDTAPWGKQDSIRLIIVGGVNYVGGNRWGLGWPHHSNRYGGGAVVAGSSPHFNKELVFHELGHCFALYHKEHSDHLLDHYEARWLSKHYHFNNNANNFTYPEPVHKNPTLTAIGNNIIRFELPVMSNIGLHQAMIFNTENIMVLGYDYLNGKAQDVVSFDVARHKWGHTATLQIMDTRGNHHMAIGITINLPEEKEVNKNPDLPTTPNTIKEDTKDNVVYLTLIKGGKDAPNEHGIIPINPVAEYKNGWGSDNITDNQTNNGNPIIIRNTTFERGISLSPPGAHNNSILQYDISENRYVDFRGYIGITNDRTTEIDNHHNQSCNVGGSSIFTFKIDNKEVYKSELLTGRDAAILVEFDIPAKSNVLEIIINSGPDGEWCDHPAIGDAKLISDKTIVDSEQIFVNHRDKLVTIWAKIKKQ